MTEEYDCAVDIEAADAQREIDNNLSQVLPVAVTVLLTNGDKILGVSRKYDQNNFGLPGGKVDQGETVEQAAVREALEETGLKIYNLQKIFEHTEDSRYWTICFSADYSGKIHTRESGQVRWIDQDTLFAGCFGRYNRKLFAAIGR